MKTVKYGKREITPCKIVCVGRNFTGHIRELKSEIPDNMVIFSKPNSAITSSLISYQGEPIHYEGEICFLIDQGILAAVAFGLDLTKRETQDILKVKGLPWERAKAFDGSALFSEFVPLPRIWQNLSLELLINGKIVQSGGIEEMIYKPQQIIEEIQTFLTLNNGDIIMTGTPQGVGIVSKGDIFEGAVYTGGNLLVSEKWQAE
ncbi:MAG: fumarylacetoacetate hydrolase family protein [Candidatus Cloacimonetes bacterium]|nr:fumarylacetoacetate hydrolase family protein [Candidatus Cloacimonadota bacterium]